MKVSFYMLMAMSLIVTQINADEPALLDTEKVDEVVVTSSILNTSRISNPLYVICLLYTSPSPRDTSSSRMPSSA